MRDVQLKYREAKGRKEKSRILRELSDNLDCHRKHAIRLESAQVLPRDRRLKYRRAAAIIESFFAPWRIFLGPTADPRVPPQYDVLDPEITSQEPPKKVIENLSPMAQRLSLV
ncbi:MAG: hypothetical protein ABII00_05590 [Elusimicrobiota bacterium]